MATTAGKVKIFNMALGFIGTRTIASESEQTPEAIQCSLYWDSARRSALRDYPWHFAQTRELLAEKTLPKIYEGVWQYAYAVPDQCLKVHGIYSQGGKRKHYFEMARYDDGSDVILTNIEKAIVAYTIDVKETTKYDEDFVYALARKLACLISIPLLKNNSQKVQELVNLYNAALPVAYDADSSERKDKEELDSWIRIRNEWQQGGINAGLCSKCSHISWQWNDKRLSHTL